MYKFNIGDYVTVKPNTKAVEVYGNKYDKPQVGLVVQRVSEECPGGTQHNYFIRLASVLGSHVDLLRFNEVELDWLAEQKPTIKSKLVDAVEDLMRALIMAGDENHESKTEIADLCERVRQIKV